MLADITGNVHDAGDYPLTYETAAVPDHTNGLPVASEKAVRGIAHVGTGGRVCRQDSSLGSLIINQHVHTDGARRIQPFHHGHSRDVKTEGGHHN